MTSMAEFDKAQAVYEAHQEQLEKEHPGEFVAIDSESEDYETGDTVQEAENRLLGRQPGARIVVTEVGPNWKDFFQLSNMNGEFTG